MPSSAPPEQSSHAAAVNNNEDDEDFGAFSAFETATFTDDDGPPSEDLVNKSTADDEPQMAETIASAFNDNNIEFADAPFEAATVNQIEANQPVDLFSNSAVVTEIKTSDNLEAVELKGADIVENVVGNIDPFSTFDALVDNTEGGGEQSDIPLFNQQNADVVGDEFGDFEGGNSGSNDFDNTPPSSNETGSAVVVPDPVTTEVANDTNIVPDDNGAASNEFDAFADVKDAPLPAFNSVKSEIIGDPFSETSKPDQEVSEINTVETSDNDFGAFEENNGIEENAAVNEDYNEEGENVGEVENPSEEITSEVSLIDTEETPVDVSNVEPVGGNDDDLFGAFEETSPVQPLQDTPAEITDKDSTAEILNECVDIKVSTTSFEEGTEDASANEDKPNTRNDNFGFTSFEATIAVEKITTDKTEGGSVEDKDPGESIIEESDGFGAFTAPTEGNREIDLAQAEHDITVDNVAALIDNGFERDIAVDDVEIQRNDDFGDFEAPTVNETPDDVDTPLSAEDTAVMANTDEGSDDFGDFTDPKEISSLEQNISAGDDVVLKNDASEKNGAADDAEIEKEEDFGAFSAPIEEDAAIAPETVERENAVDNKESVGNDEFGDFEAPNQKELPVATDASLNEEEGDFVESAVEDCDDFGDFNASNDVPTVDLTQEPDLGDFGEFAAPPMLDDNEEALANNDLPSETDVGLTEQGTDVPKEGIDDNDFGDFSTHVEDTVVVENDVALAEKDDVSPQETAIEAIDDFGDFSAPVETESAIDASDAVENGDFGDFNAPAEQLLSPAEDTVNESDEFGDFDGFSSPTTEVEATAAAIGGTDDDFNDFGEFSAPTETDTATDTKEGAQKRHEPVDMQPAIEDDDDFGDFAAFEEATPTEITGNQSPAQEIDKAAENGTSTPPVQQEVAPGGEDEFGDFGEFEEPDKVVVDENSGENEPSKSVNENKEVVGSAEDEFGDFGDFEEPNEAVKETGDENETCRPVHVLDENIRAMFQNVFKIDNPVNLENGDGDVKLPFDNPMRTVLVSSQ